MEDKELEEKKAQEEYKTKWIEAEYKTLGWKPPEEVAQERAEAYDAGMKDGAAEAARANSRLKQAVEQALIADRKRQGEWLEENKGLFLGNFRAGDNLGDLISMLKQGKEVKQ